MEEVVEASCRYKNQSLLQAITSQWRSTKNIIHIGPYIFRKRNLDVNIN